MAAVDPSPVTATPAETAVPPEPPRPAVDAMKSRLGKKLRVTIKDGRVFTGVFSCFDKGCNLILTNAETYVDPEVAFNESSDEKRRRRLNNIIVPGDHIVTVEAEVK